MTLLDDPQPTSDAPTAPQLVAIEGHATEAELVRVADRLHELRADGTAVVLDLRDAALADRAALASFFARLGARPDLPPLPAACPDLDVQRLARSSGASAAGVVLFHSLSDAEQAARR